MNDKYTRDSRSDLSGMSKESALLYLKPYYKTDEDLSVENIKFALGPWLLLLVIVGSVVGFVWSIAVLL